MNDNRVRKKKPYQKPCIKYEKKIEAFAAVCSPAGIFKGVPGQPNRTIGVDCTGWCSYLFT